MKSTISNEEIAAHILTIEQILMNVYKIPIDDMNDLISENREYVKKIRGEIGRSTNVN